MWGSCGVRDRSVRARITFNSNYSIETMAQKVSLTQYTVTCHMAERLEKQASRAMLSSLIYGQNDGYEAFLNAREG